MTTFPSAPPPQLAAHDTRPRRAPKVNRLLPTLELNSTLWIFSNPPNPQRFWAWRHSHFLVAFPIWSFYFEISEWHIHSTRAWTPALILHVTNPWAKWKVLSQTKPKGKIYKTKSLGHYITCRAKKKFYIKIKRKNSFLWCHYEFISGLWWPSYIYIYIYIKIHQ